MLLYINIIQIFLGMFLDMAAHILITTPLFLPLAMQMGVGPGAVRHDAAAELRAGAGASAGGHGAVHRLRDRQDVDRGNYQGGVAVLPGYLHRHQTRDLRADVFDVVAERDKWTPGFLT